MNKSKYFLAGILIMASCNLEEINENPNVPNEVPLSTLLPSTQKTIADVQGGQLFRITSIFAQQMEGIQDRPLGYERYNPDELFVANSWSDLYTASIVNLKILEDQALQEGSPYYAGVSKILQAQAFGLLTDTWGNIPFFEAAQGPEAVNPQYDSQEIIYQEIQELLDEAIVDLNLPESILSPGADDIIYNGNIQNWIRAAYMLKARYSIRTTKRNPNAASEALTYLNLGFVSSDQDLEYPYLGTGEDINPINAYIETQEYMIVDPEFIDLMDSLGDPRIEYNFVILPFTGGQRRPSTYYAGPSSTVEFAGFLEQVFIRSEALLRTGDVSGAETALREAVELAMDQVSGGEITQEEIDNYLEENARLDGSFESNLRSIIIQKYIALFTTPEPWADFRRTGYPELEPNENGTSTFNPNGEIPRRLIYPQSERLRNTSFPTPAPNMQDRFWWDQ